MKNTTIKKILAASVLIWLMSSQTVAYVDYSKYEVKNYNVAIGYTSLKSGKDINKTYNFNLCSLQPKTEFKTQNSIKWIVKNSDGTPLEWATVTFENIDTKESTQVMTDFKWIYSSDNLFPGKYSVKFSCTTEENNDINSLLAWLDSGFLSNETINGCQPKYGYYKEPTVYFNYWNTIEVKNNVILNWINGILEKKYYAFLQWTVNYDDKTPAKWVEVSIGWKNATTDENGNYILNLKEGEQKIVYNYSTSLDNEQDDRYVKDYIKNPTASSYSHTGLVNLVSWEKTKISHTFERLKKPIVRWKVIDQQWVGIPWVDVAFSTLKTQTKADGTYELMIKPMSSKLAFRYIDNAYNIEKNILEYNNWESIDILWDTIVLNRNMMFNRVSKEAPKQIETGKIVWQVTNSLKEPVSNAIVTIKDHQVQTDKQGHYEAEVPTGDYILIFEHPEYTSDIHYVTQKTKSGNLVHLWKDQLLTIDTVFNMDELKTIKWTVTDNLKNKLDSVKISFVWDLENNYIGKKEFTTYTDINGNYELKAIAGKWNLTFEFQRERYTYNIDDLNYNVIEKGESLNINFTPKSWNIDQTETHLNSTPWYYVEEEILHQDVSIAISEKLKWVNATFVKKAYSKVIGKIRTKELLEPLAWVKIYTDWDEDSQYSDKDGNYVLWIKPGEKRKVTFDYSNYISDESYVVENKFTQTFDIKENTNTTFNQTFDRRSYSSINGYVRTNTNRPLEWALVTLTTSYWDVWAVVLTWPNGAYNIPKIRSWEYTLKFTNINNDTFEKSVFFKKRVGNDLKLDQMIRWEFNWYFTEINCKLHSMDNLEKILKKLQKYSTQFDYVQDFGYDFKPTSAKEPEITNTLWDHSDDALESELAINWEIFKNETTYKTDYNKDFKTQYNWDGDAYYYEPSWAHGLLEDNSDENYNTLRDYITTNAKSSNFWLKIDDEKNTLPTNFSRAQYTYAIWKFYLSDTTLKDNVKLIVDSVDDGVEVILNKTVIWFEKLGKQLKQEWNYVYAKVINLNTSVFNTLSDLLKSGENEIIIIHTNTSGKKAQLDAKIVLEN